MNLTTKWSLTNQAFNNYRFKSLFTVTCLFQLLQESWYDFHKNEKKTPWPVHFERLIKSVTANLLPAKRYWPLLITVLFCWHTQRLRTHTCTHILHVWRSLPSFMLHARRRSVVEIKVGRPPSFHGFDSEELACEMDVKLQSTFLSPGSLCDSQCFGFHVTVSLKTRATDCQVRPLWWTWFSSASKM